MRAFSIAATTALALASLTASPAFAQRDRRDPQTGPVQNSPVAMQAMQGSDQPHVLLDIPNLSIEQLTVDVTNLQVHLAVDAQLANLLHLTAGADARIDNVRIDLRGVRAQATLIVRLDNVRAIIEPDTADAGQQPADRRAIAVDRRQHGGDGWRGCEQCREHGGRRRHDRTAQRPAAEPCRRRPHRGVAHGRRGRPDGAPSHRSRGPGAGSGHGCSEPDRVMAAGAAGSRCGVAAIGAAVRGTAKRP